MFAQGQQNSHIIHMACDEMANKNKQMAFEKKKQQQLMRAQTKYADGWKKQKKKSELIDNLASQEWNRSF